MRPRCWRPHRRRSAASPIARACGFAGSSNGCSEGGPMRVNLRAAAVRDVLATRGADLRRMFVEGTVAAQPVADDSTPEGRAKNCRVKIKIYGAVHGFVQDLVQR